MQQICSHTDHPGSMDRPPASRQSDRTVCHLHHDSCSPTCLKDRSHLAQGKTQVHMGVHADFHEGVHAELISELVDNRTIVR